MLFSDIKPYLRFVRTFTLCKQSKFPLSYPYDARMFFCLEGQGEIFANDKSYLLKKGSVIFINSGIKYQLSPPSKSVSYLAVNFDYTFENSNKKAPIIPATAEEYNKSQLVEHTIFTDVSELNEVFYLENFSSVEKRLIQMEREYKQKFNHYELRLSSLMIEVLIRALRERIINSSVCEDVAIANKIVEFVIENYNTELSNKQIAQMFNYHPNYISSLIKKYTGMPLHKYIKNIRVAKATDMLSISDISITEVAELCGFYDASHFIRCFKDVIGITPLQYRSNCF